MGRNEILSPDFMQIEVKDHYRLRVKNIVNMINLHIAFVH